MIVEEEEGRKQSGPIRQRLWFSPQQAQSLGPE